MLISPRSTRMLLEGAERAGVEVAPILAALGLERERFASDAPSVPWTLFARLCAEVSKAVNDDQARLTEIGLAMMHGPANASIHRLAQTVMSPRPLYEIAVRWLTPARFPFIRASVRFDGNRVIIDGGHPESLEPAEAFHRISAGTLASIPTYLGLPPAKIDVLQVTPRTLYVELILPPSRPSILASGRRAVGALVRRFEREQVLEEERAMLAEGLASTERARSEFRTALERMPALVAIHVDGTIVFANRALARAIDWPSPESLIGTRLIDIVHPRTHPLYEARVNQPTSVEYPELTEAWLVKRSGEPVLIEVCPPQAIELDGRPARLLIGRDIDERDQLQKQLATADRLAALGLLAAGVAHEVNNPLAYLLNNIEIATKQLAGLGPTAETARSALAIALEGAHRIRFIVRELLLLAREDPTPAASADLVGAVESTLALAKVEIARTARLKMDIEPVPPVRGSVPRIAQVVLNLVLNSLEAMSGRSPEVNELTVRIRSLDDGFVLLEVGDNGVGVNAVDHERVFLPFFTTKPAGKGTGLGLAVTQRLVSELGGEISFTSERNRGTTFRVRFPVAAAEPADAVTLSQMS